MNRTYWNGLRPGDAVFVHLPYGQVDAPLHRGEVVALSDDPPHRAVGIRLDDAPDAAPAWPPRPTVHHPSNLSGDDCLWCSAGARTDGAGE